MRKRIKIGTAAAAGDSALVAVDGDNVNDWGSR
jgi:hypothetical protein